MQRKLIFSITFLLTSVYCAGMAHAYTWTDDPLNPGQSVKAVHINELQAAAKDYIENRCGKTLPATLTPVSPGDTTLNDEVNALRVAIQHLYSPQPVGNSVDNNLANNALVDADVINDMRTALNNNAIVACTPVCPNAVCEAALGESCTTCLQDCPCAAKEACNGASPGVCVSTCAAVGLACTAQSDCCSDTCYKGLCVNACGLDGVACTVPEDCCSNTCEANVCVPAPSCDNDVICEIGLGETNASCPSDCWCGDNIKAPDEECEPPGTAICDATCKNITPTLCGQPTCYACSGVNCLVDNINGPYATSNCNNACTGIGPCGQATCYACSGNSCVQDNSNGNYAAPDCNNVCAINGPCGQPNCYSCSSGSCISDNANGTYTTANCNNACGNPNGPCGQPTCYKCNGLSCIQDNANGTFDTFYCDNTCLGPCGAIDCYRCSGNTCVQDDANGTLPSSNCNGTCGVITNCGQPTCYRCDGGGNCIVDNVFGDKTDPTCGGCSTVSCNNGETQSCVVNGCSGAQVCSGGSWSSCVKDPCNDGNACTANDACSAGSCSGTPVVCSGGASCISGTCVGACGQANCYDCSGTSCVSNINGLYNDASCAGDCTSSTCSDGATKSCTTDGCLGTETCSGGAWGSCVKNSCNDGDSCTTGDSCNAGVCDGAPVSCSGGKTCQGGTCVGACGQVNCYACSGSSCDPNSGGSYTDPSCGGACVVTTCTNGATRGCTTDGCLGTETCSGGAWGSCVKNSCNDGDSCTTGDSCNAGVCDGTPMNCSGTKTCQGGQCVGDCGQPNCYACSGTSCGPSDSGGFTDSSCNGSCSVCSNNATQSCTTSDGCPGNETCSGGAWGSCIKVNCNDGDACTTGDACNNGACSGTPVVCDSGKTCQGGSCACPSACTYQETDRATIDAHCGCAAGMGPAFLNCTAAQGSSGCTWAPYGSSCTAPSCSGCSCGAPCNPATAAGISPTSPSINVGQSVAFTASASGGTAPYLYQFYWSDNGGNTWTTATGYTTNNTYSFTPPAAGTYLVTVWTKSSCSTAGGPGEVPATASVTATNTSCTCSGGSLCDGTPLTTTACGTTVCGGGNVQYTCQGGAWVATGACSACCSPINGGWSDWGACSGGTQTRTCDNPPPSCGGAGCSGASSQGCGGCGPAPHYMLYNGVCTPSCGVLNGICCPYGCNNTSKGQSWDCHDCCDSGGCNTCGNGACEGGTETCSNCPQDCGSCGCTDPNTQCPSWVNNNCINGTWLEQCNAGVCIGSTRQSSNPCCNSDSECSPPIHDPRMCCPDDPNTGQPNFYSYCPNSGPNLGVCQTDICTGCFLAGTMVDTPDGRRPIQDIKTGDSIFAADPDTGEKVATTVEAMHIKTEPEYLVVTLSNGTKLNVTPHHPFYVPATKNFIPIGELKVGDELLHVNAGQKTLVKILEITKIKDDVAVYHPSVKHKLKTFVVEDIVVHNKIAC